MKNFLVEHRDWWLPVITTFVGVFSAAWLTIAIQEYEKDLKAENLISVAWEDICTSLNSVEKAQERLEKKSKFSVISEPRIMLSLLKNNATLLGEFNPESSPELIAFTSEIEIDVEAYRENANQANAMKKFIPIAKLDENEKMLAFAELEQTHRQSQATKILKSLEYALSRSAFILSVEHGMREDEYTREEATGLIKAAKYNIPCTKNG